MRIQWPLKRGIMILSKVFNLNLTIRLCKRLCCIKYLEGENRLMGDMCFRLQMNYTMSKICKRNI